MARKRDVAAWELNRQRVLTAAIDLFAEHGYDKTSMQQIADRLGVTKAAIYYYFPTKAGLLDAVFGPSDAAANALLDAAEREPTYELRVAAALAAMVETAVANRATLAVLNRDPAVGRHPTAMHNALRLQDRLQLLFYGPAPSPEQRAAFHLSYGMSGAVLQMPDLTDEQLRVALGRVIRRTLDLQHLPTSDPGSQVTKTGPLR